jgi:hypothetical protein
LQRYITPSPFVVPTAKTNLAQTIGDRSMLDRCRILRKQIGS